MENYLIAFFAAILGSLIGPLIVLKFKWAAEKRHEAFIIAVRALSRYELDATDPELQKLKVGGQENKLTPDTIGLIAKSYAFVRVHFSRETYDKFIKAMAAELKPGQDNADFRILSDDFIDAVEGELLVDSWLLRRVKLPKLFNK